MMRKLKTTAVLSGYEIPCSRGICDHWNINGTCMYGLTPGLIEYARRENTSMCPVLREKVLEIAGDDG